jgi:glycosyltransferase involved in cell wall biosynthesis
LNGTICHIKFGILAKLSPLLHELGQAADSPFEHHVILPSYNNDADYLHERFPDVIFRFVHLTSREMSASRNPVLKLVRYLEFVRSATKEAIAIRADLYVAHDVTAMIPGTRAARKNRAAMVYRAPELFSEAGREISPLPWLWNKVERYYVGKTDFIVVPEQNRAEIYKNEYGAKRMPAVVRNIPPVTGEYRKTSFLRDTYNAKDSTVLCLYQGIITPSRCIRELIESMVHLPQHFTLVLIGHVPDDYLDILQMTVRRNSLEGRTHFLDFMPPERLPDVTASADLGILLYRNENRNNYYAAPNKIYEYLFAGLPVVTSNFPGLQAPVQEHGVGAWTDPEDPKAIAQAIVRASEVPGGNDLARRMRGVFRWEDEYATLQAVYKQTQRQ